LIILAYVGQMDGFAIMVGAIVVIVGATLYVTYIWPLFRQ